MNITELNAALPERLRIDDAPNITAALDQATADGWTAPALAAHLQRKCGPTAGTGAVVWQIRNLGPAPAGPKPITRHQGHTVCTEHREGCEVCRCDPDNPTHHRRSQAITDHTWARIAAEMRAILDTDGEGPVTYREPDDHPGRLPCLCPDPVTTFALVATGHLIEPGECPLHRAWLNAATING
jgi:hypothetical protein